MKRGKKRTNDAIRDVVVTDNVMGIISEGNAYVLREQIPTLVREMGETEDGYVLSQESEEYLKEQKMLFEKRKKEFRNRQENNDFFNLIVMVSWDFWLISISICLFCVFQILLSDSILEFLRFGFFMIGFCVTVSDKMLNLVSILSSGLEKVHARKIAAIHKTINAYKEKGEIPNIKEVEEADRTPSIKCNASVRWRLGINLILLGCILNIIDVIFHTSNVDVQPIIILIVVVLIYLTIKQKIYNWETTAKMLTPSEKEISEAIVLLKFFVNNQKNSSTK